MGTIQAGPYRLFVTERGEGRVLVFIHGANGNQLSWWRQIPVFAARFRCLAYDQPGFGLSPSLTESIDADCFPDALGELLTAVGVERACLVAQSLGTTAAVGFALANPHRVSGLVLASGTGDLVDIALQARIRAHRIEQGTADDLYRGALPEEFRVREPGLALLFDSIAALNPPRPPGLVPGAFTCDLDAPAVAQFKNPVLLVVGEKDALTPLDAAERVAAAFPNGRVARLPGVGHSAHFEDPPSFNATLADFLEDLAW